MTTYIFLEFYHASNFFTFSLIAIVHTYTYLTTKSTYVHMYVCTHEQSFSYPRGKELFSGGLEILLKASDGNKQRNLLTHSLGPVFCIMARKKFTRVEGSHRRLHELP